MKMAKDNNELAVLSDAGPGRRGAQTLGIRMPLCMGKTTDSLGMDKERSVQFPRIHQIHTHKLKVQHH